MSFRKNSFGKSNFRKGRSLKATSSLILCGTTSIGMMTLNSSSNVNAGWWDYIARAWKWLSSWIGLSTQKGENTKKEENEDKNEKNLSTVIERPKQEVKKQANERWLSRSGNDEVGAENQEKDVEGRKKEKTATKTNKIKKEKGYIEAIEVEEPEFKDPKEDSGEYFKESVDLLKKEYPENFNYDPDKGSVYGEYTGDVSAKGDLELNVSIKKLNPNLNEGKKYQAEFFGRKFYFETDKDLLKHVQKHVKYRKKLKSYIEKFKEIAATGKFTLKVVKEKQEIIDTHKIVLKIVDWGSLRFKERKGSCISGFEIVLDHYENVPVVDERYNAYKTKTPFYTRFDDGVSVSSTNYAFTRPSNEKELDDLFGDLLNSIEEYRVQYVERTKKVFDNVFGKIEWKQGKNDGEWEGVFEIKGVSFPVSVYASKGPENYGKICGMKFLENYLPNLEEYNDWVSNFKYLFENCYEKFKMCEKGGNFKISVGERNVIVLEPTNKKSVIDVPGALLGDYFHCENYSEELRFDKKDTVAVNKIEFDVVYKKISIYSEDEKKYCYKLDDFGAWHLAFKKDAPFETRFNKFLDHLVAEVKKMVAKEEERKQRKAEEEERRKQRKAKEEERRKQREAEEEEERKQREAEEEERRKQGNMNRENYDSDDGEDYINNSDDENNSDYELTYNDRYYY